MLRAAWLTAFVVAGCGNAPLNGPPAAAASNGGRVVVISVDGMMPDSYLAPDAHGLAIPTLRALVARGAAARVHGVMPAVTYPSHTTLVTGVPPLVHGIVGNQPVDPLGKNLAGFRWYAEDIAVPTLYQVVEAQHRVAALIYWPVTVGARATVVVPEYWRAGNGDDQKLLRALSTPGLLDEVERVEPALWKLLTPPNVKDHAQIAIARHVWATRHPDLMLVHIFQLDDAQHIYGPWSPEATSILEAVDRELGLLLGDLERSPEWPRTTLLIVSDHGFAPIDTEIRLGALLVKHGLLRTDPDGSITSADVAMVSNGGSVLFYVLDPARRSAVDSALAELGAHVARRIEHDELVAMGADPRASFALVAAPGHGFNEKRTGEVIHPAALRGVHGWPPDDPAMASSLVAYGPHVPAGPLGTVEMIDIAPTIAHWLGVALPKALGKPIAKLVADKPR